MSASVILPQVIDLLRGSGLAAGAHVPEQWIADALGVSRSPVHRTLNELESFGLVRREPNRGFFLSRSAESLSLADGLALSDPVEQAYYRIGEDHLNGHFAGELTAAEVCRRYSLTAQQANRLFSRLESEDLIQRRRGRGWEFRSLLSSAEAYEDSFQFRMILEPAALLQPGFKVEAETLAQHRAEQEALLGGDLLLLSNDAIFRVNVGFHEMLMAASNNTYITDAVQRVNRSRRFMEYRQYTDKQEVNREVVEHLELLDLVESNDLTAASELMYRHLDGMRKKKSRPNEV